MSERVSDERLRELASIQSRAAATYALEFDEDVLAVIEELLERRAADRPDNATRYESELRRLSEFVQSRHPSGAVKHIGLMEAVPAAMELISDADDDNEPITAEWWYSVFDDQQRVDVPGVTMRISAEIAKDGLRVVLCTWNGASQAYADLLHIRTRGDLRRLWFSLTGKELGS